ncbi:MAG: hypothetical protein JJ879_06355 [Sneathiella sp.]|nr:hypothetical protein [Sneathiella sp.]
MTEIDTDIQRALAYPYERPTHSFLLEGETISRLHAWEPEEHLIPVLACGSNAAPEQLIRKFKDHPNQRIPVTAGKLKNFVSVYSPHVAGYGSIPATLMPLEGVTTTCHITWLTEDQLVQMHLTEAIGSSYRYSELRDIDLQCEMTGPHEKIHAYIGRRGVLRLNGSYIGLSAIPIEGQHEELTLMSQTEVQEATAHTLNHKNNINRFIEININTNNRHHVIEALKDHASPYPLFNEIIIYDEKLND